MKISIQCGQCGKQYQVKPELAGKKVKCQGCGTPILIPAAVEPEAPAKKSAPAKAAPAKAGAKTQGQAAKPQAAAGAKPQAAKKPAAAPPNLDSPVAAPKPLHNILDEAMAGAARLPTAGEIYCPGCKAIIQANAVICVNCGFDLQSGRNTRTSSEANRRVRPAGAIPPLGILLAVVAIFYGLAGAGLFTTCIVFCGIILAKLGLPVGNNPEPVIGMFGLPVFILLSVAGFLMLVSGVGILRKVKGATLNAALGAKLYTWTLIFLAALTAGNAIYRNTDKYKESAAKEAEELARLKEKKVQAATKSGGTYEEPDLGKAAVLTKSNIMAYVNMANLPKLLALAFAMLIAPACIWAWGATQGRKWDWGLPEPVHKLKLKPVAKVHGPSGAEPKK